MTTIVAFDYNGTLTTEDGVSFFKNQVGKDDVVVGVLTANMVLNAKRFLSRENIDADFVRRGIFKAPELFRIALCGGDKHIYVGNSITDELAASIAGWEYIDIDDL